VAATVELDGESSEFRSVELVLAERSGPVVVAWVSGRHPWNTTVRTGLLRRRVEGTIDWEGESITFQFLGFREADAALGVVGLVLDPELVDWLTENPGKDTGADVLCYQRQEADADGWAFLRRVLGQKFAAPELGDTVGEAFTDGACILRPTAFDNRSHVERVVGLLGGYPGATYSWTVFDAEDGDDPFRLLMADEGGFAADDSWSPADSRSGEIPSVAALPSPTGRLRLERGFTAGAPGDAAQLLAKLTRSGREGVAESLDDGAQLPPGPGPVEYGEAKLVCRRVSYRFRFGGPTADDLGVVLNVQMELTAVPPMAPASRLRWSGHAFFSDWDGPSGQTRAQLSAEGTKFRLMGDGDSPDATEPDDGKRLVVEVLTPFHGRNGFAGVYPTRRPEDEMVVTMADGELPYVSGQVQVYVQDLDAVELVLNAETVTASGLDPAAGLEAADGWAVDGAAGTVHVFAESAVELKQRVKVEDEKTTLDQDAEITGKLGVGS